MWLDGLQAGAGKAIDSASAQAGSAAELAAKLVAETLSNATAGSASSTSQFYARLSTQDAKFQGAANSAVANAQALEAAQVKTQQDAAQGITSLGYGV